MIESSKNNIVETVKRLREKTGLSQEKLSRFADVLNNTIAKIEVDSTPNSTDTIKKIADALGVSLDDLMK